MSLRDEEKDLISDIGNQEPNNLHDVSPYDVSSHTDIVPQSDIQRQLNDILAEPDEQHQTGFQHVESSLNLQLQGDDQVQPDIEVIRPEESSLDIHMQAVNGLQSDDEPAHNSHQQPNVELQLEAELQPDVELQLEAEPQPDVGIHVEAISQHDVKNDGTQPNVDLQLEAESEPDAELQLEDESQPEGELQVQATKSHSDVEQQLETESQSDVELQVEADSQYDVKIDGPQSEPDAELQLEAELEQDFELQLEAELEPDFEVHQEAESRHDVSLQVVADYQHGGPQSDGELQLEAESEPDAEPQQEAESEPDAEPQQEAESEPDAELQLETESQHDELQVQATESHLDVEQQLETESQCDVELHVEADSQHDVEQQLEAESKLEAESHPDVELQLEGELQPDVELQLEDEPQQDGELQLEDECLYSVDDPPAEILQAVAELGTKSEMEQNCPLATDTQAGDEFPTQSDFHKARCSSVVLPEPQIHKLSITELPAQLHCNVQSVVVDASSVVSGCSIETPNVDSNASNNPRYKLLKLAMNLAIATQDSTVISHAKSNSEEKQNSINDDVPLVSETAEAIDKEQHDLDLDSTTNKEIKSPTSHYIKTIGQGNAACSNEIDCRTIVESCILMSDASISKPCKPLVLDSKMDDNGTMEAHNVSGVPNYLCESVSETVVLSDTEPDDNKSNSDVLLTQLITKELKSSDESFTNTYHHPKGKGILRYKQSYKIDNSVITTINKNVKSLLALKLQHNKDTKKPEGLKQTSISEYMKAEDPVKHVDSKSADDVYTVKLAFPGDGGINVDFSSDSQENKDVIWITDESTGEVCSLNANPSAYHSATLNKTRNSTQKQAENKHPVIASDIDSGERPTNNVDHGNLQDIAKVANYTTIVDQREVSNPMKEDTQSKDDKKAVLDYYQDQLPKRSTVELASKPDLAFPVHVYCHAQESDDAAFNDANNEAMYPGNFTLSGNPTNYDKSTTQCHEGQVTITDASSAISHSTESNAVVDESQRRGSVFPVSLVQHSGDADSLSSASRNETANECQIVCTRSNNVTGDQKEQFRRNTVNILRPFHCNQGLCMEKFETANMLVDHVEKMHSQPDAISINIFKCNKCMFSTNVQSCIDNHMSFCQKSESNSPNLINDGADLKIKTDEDVVKSTININIQCLICKSPFGDHGSYFQHVCESHIRCIEDALYCPFCNFGVCLKYILIRHIYFKHFDADLPPENTLKKLWHVPQYYDPLKHKTASTLIKEDKLIESKANYSSDNKNSENKVTSSSGGERPKIMATVKKGKRGKGRGRPPAKQKTMPPSDKCASSEEKITSTVSLSPPGETTSVASSLPTGKNRALRKSTNFQTKASQIMKSNRLSTDLKAKKNDTSGNSKTPAPAIEGICKPAEQEDNVHDKANVHKCSTRCVSKLKPEYELPNVDCYIMKYCSGLRGYFVCKICHAVNTSSMGLLRSHIFDIHLKLTPYRCSKCEYKSICYFAVEKHLKMDHTSSKHYVLMELSEFQHDKIQQGLKDASNSTGADVRRISIHLEEGKNTDKNDGKEPISSQIKSKKAVKKTGKEPISSRIKSKNAEKRDGKDPMSQSQEVACNSEVPSEPVKDINSSHSCLAKVNEKKEDNDICIYVVSSDDECVSGSDNEGDTVGKAAGKSSDNNTSKSANSQNEVQSRNKEQNSTDDVSTENEQKPIAVVNTKIPESIQNLQMVFPNLTKPLEACYVPVSKKKFGCRLCRMYTSMFWRQTQEHLLDQHLKVYPYSCKYCDYKSVSYVNVQTHLRTEHTNENSHILVEPEESVLQMIKTALKGIPKEPLAKSKDQTTKKGQSASESMKQQTPVKATKHTSKNMTEDVTSIVPVRDVDVNSSPLTQGDIWACKECNFLTSSKRILLKHIYRHLDYKPYSCRICSCLLSYDEIKGHFKESHPSMGLAIDMVHVTEMEVKVKEMIGKVKKQPLSDVRMENDDPGTSDNVSLKAPQGTAECSNQSSSNMADTSSKTLPMQVNTGDSISKSEGSYRCPKCKFHSCLRTTVRRHIRTYHRIQHNRINDSEQEIKALNCDLCSFVTDDADYLRKHYRIHVLKESLGLTQTCQGSTSAFSCTSQGCRKRFTSIKERNLHSQSVHNRPDKKICSYPECGKQFQTEKQCRGHYYTSHRKHASCRLYSCLYVDCKRKFKTEVQRKYHMRTSHRNVTAASKDSPLVYSCLELGCKEKFQTISERRQHVAKCRKNKQKANISDPERPYLCPDPKCDKSYTSYDGRRIHVERHHKQYIRSLNAKDVCGDLPYNCPSPGCDKRFGRKDKRSHHISQMHKDYVVHDRRPEPEKQSEEGAIYHCPVPRCSKRYSGVHGCQRHMQKQHQDYMGILVVKAAGEVMLGKAVCPWLDCEREFADLKGLQPHFIQTHGIPFSEYQSKTTRKGQQHESKATDIECETRLTPKKSIDKKSPRTSVNDRTIGTDLGSGERKEFACPWHGCMSSFKNSHGMRIHFFHHGITLSEFQKNAEKEDKRHESKEKPSPVIKCETSSPKVPAAIISSKVSSVHRKPGPACSKSKKNYDNNAISEPIPSGSKTKLPESSSSYDECSNSKPDTDSGKGKKPGLSKNTRGNKMRSKCNKTGLAFSRIKLPDSSSSDDEFSDNKPDIDSLKGKKPGRIKSNNGNKKGSHYSKPGLAVSKTKFQDSSSSEDEFNDSKPDADNLKGHKTGQSKIYHGNKIGSKYRKPGPLFSKMKFQDSSSSSSSSDDDSVDQKPEIVRSNKVKPEWATTNKGNKKSPKYNKPGPVSSKRKLSYVSSSDSDDDSVEEKTDTVTSKQKKHTINRIDNRKKHTTNFSKPGPASSKRKSNSKDSTSSSGEPIARILDTVRSKVNNQKWSKVKKSSEKLPKYSKPIPTSSSDDEVDLSSSSREESKKIISTSWNKASASKKRNSGLKRSPRGKHKKRKIGESTSSGNDSDESNNAETSNAGSDDESARDTKPTVSTLHCCHLCRFENVDNREFARHLACHKVFNITPSLSCSHCKFKSRKYSIMNKHIKLHKDEPLFECHYCSSFQSTASKDVLVHCETEHPEQAAAVWGKFENKIIFRTGFADLEPSLTVVNVASADNLAKTARANDIGLVRSPKGVVLYPSDGRTDRTQSILYCCHVCSYSTSDRDMLFSHIMKH